MTTDDFLNVLACARALELYEKWSVVVRVVRGRDVPMTGSAALATLAISRYHDGSRLVAVDIGRNGALALFVAGCLVEVADMPVLADGPAGRPTVNAPLLAALVRRWSPDTAIVEHVAARPGEAPSGAFAFGRSRGAIEGVLGAAGIPVRFTTPAAWKRRVGIPAGRDSKDMARSTAIAVASPCRAVCSQTRPRQSRSCSDRGRSPGG